MAEDGVLVLMQRGREIGDGNGLEVGVVGRGRGDDVVEQDELAVGGGDGEFRAVEAVALAAARLQRGIGRQALDLAVELTAFFQAGDESLRGGVVVGRRGFLKT